MIFTERLEDLRHQSEIVRNAFVREQDIEQVRYLHLSIYAVDDRVID